MITVNSDQIVAVWNRVVNLLVPVVLKRYYFTVVCQKTIHMATADAKPKGESFIFLEEKKIYPALTGLGK